MAFEVILEMQNISKSFPGVQALSDVTLKVQKGEVHAIVGENGAGKSTLMKILAGAYRKDSGKIIINGEEVNFRTPLDSQEKGIAIIYQEFNLAPHLSAEANIFIGREPRTKILGLIRQGQIHHSAVELFNQLNVEINPKQEVRYLSVCQQQITEIAKALSLKSSILIMDEPTSALPEDEVRILFDVIRRIKQEGVTILYISHNLEDVLEIADRLTVLRDGKYVATEEISEVNKDRIVSWMVGREIGDVNHRSDRDLQAEVILSVRHLSRKDVLNDISFDLHKGEILGIAGLLGAGRTELLRCIFGADSKTSGEIFIEGSPYKSNRPTESVKRGIAYVPEDRKLQGLFLGLSTRSNITVASLANYARLGLLNSRKEQEITSRYVESIDIRLASQEQRAINLSGGNQQKVLIARWLATNPKVLLLDDPTRGIDIGARVAIHDLIFSLANQGIGVVFVSSELPEVIKVSDRIMVLAKGQIAAEFNIEEATQEKIMNAATGLFSNERV